MEYQCSILGNILVYSDDDDDVIRKYHNFNLSKKSAIPIPIKFECKLPSLIFGKYFEKRSDLVFMFRRIIDLIEESWNEISYLFQDQQIESKSIINEFLETLKKTVISLLQVFNISDKNDIINEFYDKTDVMRYQQIFINEFYPLVKKIPENFLQSQDVNYQILFEDLGLENNDYKVDFDTIKYIEIPENIDKMIRDEESKNQYDKFVSVVNIIVSIRQLNEFQKEYNENVKIFCRQEEILSKEILSKVMWPQEKKIIDDLKSLDLLNSHISELRDDKIKGIDSLLKRMHDLQNRSEELFDENNKLKKKNQELDNDYQELNNDFNKLYNENLELQLKTDKQVSSNEVISIKAKNQALKEKIQEKEAQINDYNILKTENQELKERIQHLLEKITQIDDLNSMLKAENKDLLEKQTVGDINGEENDQYTKQSKRLSKENIKLREENKKLATENAKFKSDINNLSKENKKLKKENQKSSVKDYKELNEKYENLEKQFADLNKIKQIYEKNLNDENNSLKNLIAILEQERIKLCSSNDLLEKKGNDLAALNSEKENKIKSLEEENQQKLKEIKDSNSSCKQLIASNELLKAKISELEKKSLLKDELDIKLKELEEENQQKLKELEDSNSSCKQLIASNELLKAKISELEKKSLLKNELDIKLKELEEQISLLIQESKVKDSTITKLKSDNLHLKRDCDRLNQRSNNNNCFEILSEENIKNLEILKELGFGGFGKVLLVARKTIYALKVMIVKDSATKEFKRFIQEYEILNMLNHPSILKTYGMFFGCENSPPSILLEYCPSSISQMIKNNAYSHAKLVCSIYEIAEGMRYIHSKKVIHCDLKPANILISADGKIRISDFGISKLMQPDASISSLQGTIKFSAPEIIREEKNYTEKVDVYSFGVLLFFLLDNGNMPNINIIQMASGKKAEIPSSFTNVSKDLINSCWNLNPVDRPSFKTICEILEANKFEILSLNEQEKIEVEQYIKVYKNELPSYTD